MPNKREHTYTKYRPMWCNHPQFQSIDYCWGLAVAVDEKRLTKFKANKCKACDMSNNFYHQPESK